MKKLLINLLLLIFLLFFSACRKIENGHEYVNLGLSVKWATCNVGAERPEDYGDYFAWGEVEPKDTYNWSTYKYCNGTYDSMTKYCNKRSYGKDGFIDNKTLLVLSDDAATVNWGGAWRMPTEVEFKELVDNCVWSWTNEKGVYGYRVRSLISGYSDCSIFLPAAGFMDGETLYGVKLCGLYWSNSFFVDRPNNISFMGFSSDNVGCNGNYRYYGKSVRPVCP